MSDIFISYASADRERIQTLVKALVGKGWTVWWDPEISPGKTWDQIIEEALNNAKCVIVVWSKESVLSKWVKDEANEAAQRGILVPVLINDVKTPLGFRQIQTASLIDWQVTSPHPGFHQLSEAIESVLSHSPDSIQGQGAGGKKGEEAERLEQERREREAREKAAKTEAERRAREEELKKKTEESKSRRTSP